MSDNLDKLSNQFGYYLSGWAYSMAILDDYCNVVAKIEGVEPEIVKERIKKSADEKFQKAKSELTQP